jgi:hypothetical protein
MSKRFIDGVDLTKINLPGLSSSATPAIGQMVTNSQHPTPYAYTGYIDFAGNPITQTEAVQIGGVAGQVLPALIDPNSLGTTQVTSPGVYYPQNNTVSNTTTGLIIAALGALFLL